ncbi:MAG: 50S ribosomal protein L4, partial [Candidatus Saccharibacteria bacterium]
QSLSMAADENKIVVIEDIKLKTPKTSEAINLFKKMKLEGRVLIVVDSKDDTLVRATSNIADVKLIQSSYLNTYDTVNADFILITNKSLANISEWLGEAK